MKTQRLGVLSAPVVCAALLVAAARPATAGDWTANINLAYGQRWADKNDFEPVNNAKAVGIEASWGKSDQPVLFATDLYLSSEKQTEAGEKLTARSAELAIGVRKYFGSKLVRPYIGAGVSLISDELELQDATGKEKDKDSTKGFWAGGGAFFRLGPHLNLGAFARYAPANTVRLLGPSRDATSLTVGVTVGWGWGEKE